MARPAAFLVASQLEKALGGAHFGVERAVGLVDVADAGLVVELVVPFARVGVRHDAEVSLGPLGGGRGDGGGRGGHGAVRGVDGLQGRGGGGDDSETVLI